MNTAISDNNILACTAAYPQSLKLKMKSILRKVGFDDSDDDSSPNTDGDGSSEDVMNAMMMITTRRQTRHYRGGAGGGGDLVRTQFGLAKFGVVKIWYKIINTAEKCGTNFPESGHPRNCTRRLPIWKCSTSTTQAICFLCYSPVKQGSKLKHDVLKNGHRQNMKSDNSDPRNLVMERKCT